MDSGSLDVCEAPVCSPSSNTLTSRCWSRVSLRVTAEGQVSGKGGGQLSHTAPPQAARGGQAACELCFFCQVICFLLPLDLFSLWLLSLSSDTS